MKSKIALKIISFIGLLLTFIPSIIVYKGLLSIQVHFNLMLLGTLIWFTTAPFWMKGFSLDNESED